MNERLTFRMDGPIFKKGVPLHLVIGGLTELHHVIDKTYIVLSNKKRLSRADRKQFQVVSHEFRSSSFIAKFEILLAGAQLAMPFLTAYGPQNIWDYTRETFNFLKLIYKSNKAGEKPTYTFNDESVTVITGGTQNHFHSNVYIMGREALPAYQNYDDLLSKGGIENISIGREEQPEIELTLKDKGLFKTKSQIEEEPISLECDIFDFNKKKNSGKLIVNKDQPVAQGEYSFSVLGSQETSNYILSMLRTSVVIKCLKERIEDPLSETVVQKLHVINVTPEN